MSLVSKKKLAKMDPLTRLAAEATLGDYKHIVVVNMFGVDGNAFSILGRVIRTAKESGCPQEALDVFLDEAMSGSYEHLLQTVKRCFTVVNIRPRERATSAASAFDLYADGCDYSED